jgi:NCAIR mutase (PurE)-related protein
LKEVADGRKTPDEAAETLRNLPYEDMGFARLDHHRGVRTGSAEVVFCQGKTPEQTGLIFERLSASGGNVAGTRADRAAFEAVRARVPDAAYNETARMITVSREKRLAGGRVAVASAGTADIPVAEEAAAAAEFYGSAADRIFDIGVAGIHRLLDQAERIRDADVVIAVAGMEVALASVIGGLVDSPVIAVPTSVGYGASMGGLTALLAMLNSCSLGVCVMNIDNGFGAGYLASMISRMAVGQSSGSDMPAVQR